MKRGWMMTRFRPSWISLWIIRGFCSGGECTVARMGGGTICCNSRSTTPARFAIARAFWGSTCVV